MFVHALRVRFHEADPAGIAFFANVLTYCHTAYEEMMRAGGQPLDEIIARGEVALPLVRSEADYKRPLRYGAPVVVQVTVEELAEKRFTLRHTLVDEQGTLLAQARTVHVCASRGDMKSVALPAGIRAVLEKHVSGAA